MGESKDLIHEDKGVLITFKKHIKFESFNDEPSRSPKGVQI